MFMHIANSQHILCAQAFAWIYDFINDKRHHQASVPVHYISVGLVVADAFVKLTVRLNGFFSHIWFFCNSMKSECIRGNCCMQLSLWAMRVECRLYSLIPKRYTHTVLGSAHGHERQTTFAFVPAFIHIIRICHHRWFHASTPLWSALHHRKYSSVRSTYVSHMLVDVTCLHSRNVYWICACIFCLCCCSLILKSIFSDFQLIQR